jgi:FixJ family two-component response regulator
MTDHQSLSTKHRLQTADGQMCVSLLLEPATVFVVDDDTSFLQSVGRLLRAARFKVRTFSSAEDFLAQHSVKTSGCVLMDLEMPGMGGLELQAVLARTGNPLPVVFLTGHGDIRSSVWAMRQGAEDFLTKMAPKNELLIAVTNALARDAREREWRARQSALRACFEALSEREREVLGHVLQGKLNKQIALDLAISERTVKLHRTAITTKLKVHSVAELTKLWLDAGFIIAK